MATTTNTTDWYSMSDPAIISQVGTFLRQIRLQQNLTQELVAKKAGLSRSAISDMENGRTGTSLLTVIQVLRGLQLLQLFDNWRITSQVSPLQMARLTGKERFRASGTITKKKEESEW